MRQGTSQEERMSHSSPPYTIAVRRGTKSIVLRWTCRFKRTQVVQFGPWESADVETGPLVDQSGSLHAE